MIFNPRRADYETDGAYQKAKVSAAALVENLAAVYITPEQMLDLYHNATRFEFYIKDLLELMEGGDGYKSVPVDIKVLPSSRQGPVTARWAPFIRRAGDETINLRFTKYELELITNSNTFNNGR